MVAFPHDFSPFFFWVNEFDHSYIYFITTDGWVWSLFAVFLLCIYMYGTCIMCMVELNVTIIYTVKNEIFCDVRSILCI